MMMTLDTKTDYYTSRVRLSGTETHTDAEVIARAMLDNGIAYYFDAHVRRAEDMSGPKVFEVATVTFYRD